MWYTFPEIHLWCDTCWWPAWQPITSPHVCFSRGRMPDLIGRPPAYRSDMLTTQLLRPAILAFNCVKLKEIGLDGVPWIRQWGREIFIFWPFSKSSIKMRINWPSIGEEGFILIDWREMKCHIVNITDAIGFVLIAFSSVCLHMANIYIQQMCG